MAEARKKTQTKRALWIGAVLLLVVVFFLVRNLTRDKLPVRTASAERMDLISTISTNGKVEPQQNFEAHSPLAAVVKGLYIHEGDRVAAGQLLLSLDDIDARSRVATALTGLRNAQANYDAVVKGGTQEQISLSGEYSRAKLDLSQAQRDLSALQQLQARGAASPSEVAAAQQRVAVSKSVLATLEQRQAPRFAVSDKERVKAALDDAKTAYAAAQQILQESNVRAPFAGTVYSVPVSRTEFVDQGHLLLQLADLSKVQIRAYFDEPELGKLSVGQPIRVIWDARPGRVWTGHIVRIPSTVITYGTRNVGEVLVSVDTSDGTLLPNTNVTVTVTTAREQNTLSIPREALNTENGHAYVYKVVNGVLKRTNVTTGTVNLTQVAIRSGLNEHDVVAWGTTNGQPLTDGAIVRIAK